MAKVYGFTGLNASGKSTAAKILAEKGYKYTSLSDVLREQAEKRGLEKSRDNLYDLGNQLREKEGNGVLGKKAAEKILNEDKSYVVDSIRNPAEVEELRKLSHFTLVAVEARPESRFERAKKRGRNESAESVEEFLAKEKREMSSKDSDQQIHKCVKSADISINNDGTIEELREKINAL
ncbi:MAG: AAA family ATPase [Nanoarchaeota archaeon]